MAGWRIAGCATLRSGFFRGLPPMMDDLSSPVETGLIVYDRIEQALLQKPTRLYSLVLAAVLMLCALWLGLALHGPETLRIDATSTWRGLHQAVAPVAALLGLGLAWRQSWAVALLYPAILVLQWLPALLLTQSLAGGSISVTALVLTVVLQGMALGVMATLIIRAPGRDDSALSE
jgi:hypothetical protein